MTAASANSAGRQLFGRGSIYTLATAAPLLAGVILLPITTRLLTPEEYGVVALCLVLIQFLGILANFGLAISVTRHAILEQSGMSGARGLVVGSVLIAVLVTAAGVLTGRLWSEPLLGLPWQIAIALAIMAAGAAAVVSNVQAYLRARDMAWLFIVLAAGGTLLGPASGIVLLLLAGSWPANYVLGLAVGYSAAALGGVLIVMGGGRVRIRSGEMARAIRIGLPTIPHSLALSLATGAMILIAGSSLGLGASAALQVALFVGAVPVVVTSALNNAWAPIIMRTSETERPEVLNRTAAAIGWIAACGGSGVALLSPWVLAVVAPTSYPQAEMVMVVAIVSMTAAVSIVYLASSHLIFVTGRTAGLAVCTPVSVMAGIVAASLLVGPFGLVGAGSGFLVTYVTLAMTTHVLARRVSASRWSPSVVFFPLALAAVGSFFGAYLPSGGTGAIARVALAVGVLGLAITVIIRVVRRK